MLTLLMLLSLRLARGCSALVGTAAGRLTQKPCLDKLSVDARHRPPAKRNSQGP